MNNFFKKIQKEGDCLVWKAAKNDAGYGVCWDGKKLWYVHRYAYFLHHGEIKQGMEIDHKCYNPLCCNPEHLEQVTRQENVKRQRWSRKLFCKCGRKFDKINKRGHSICLECQKKWTKKSKHKKGLMARVV